MTDATASNAQITDAVTQANVKVLAEAPAMAMGAIYQSLAHATGLLFENAVAAQQQQNVLALAATNQGIMQIYAADSAASAGAVKQAETPDALRTRFHHAGESLKAAFAADAGVNPQIEAVVKLAADSVLGRSGDFAYGARASVDAFAAALEQISETTQRNLMRVLQTAAVAACLEAMLREPAKAAEYEAVLHAVKRMA